jgi:anti-sigma factor RsiW
MTSGMPHLSIEELAAYLDGRLSDPARARLDRHLAACDGCRDEWVATTRLVSRPVRRLRPVFVAAAAAVVALLVLPGLLQRTPRSDVQQERAGVAADALVALAPADSVLIAPDTARFVWSGSGAGASYRLTLTDSTGAVLWSAETLDTTLRPSDPALLRPGLYFWYVDARLADGRSRTTGAHQFHIAP